MPITLNGTAGVTYPDGVLQSSGTPAPGTSGNVLTSNGTIWVSSANPPAFAAGTRLAFQQTSAPTGWTKDTTAGINDSILRLVTGTVSSGGSTGWSAASIGATTLSTAEMPSHTHTYSGGTATNFGSAFGSSILASGTGIATGGTGGGGSHTHSFPSIKYYDFVIASKD